MGLSSDPQQDMTDLEHPDGRIATFGVVTLTNFSRHGIGLSLFLSLSLSLSLSLVSGPGPGTGSVSVSVSLTHSG